MTPSTEQLAVLFAIRALASGMTSQECIAKFGQKAYDEANRWLTREEGQNAPHP